MPIIYPMLGRLHYFYLKVVQSYSEIVFLQNKVVGFILLGLSFLNPFAGIGGLIAVLSAYSFAALLGFRKRFTSAGFHIYNPLLVGLAIGSRFSVTPTSLPLLVIGGVVSFIITLSLARFLTTCLDCPVLSLPFSATTLLIYMGMSQLGVLGLTSPHGYIALDLIPLPYWLTGYLHALGNLFFLPTIMVGALIAILLIASSRILFALSFFGYILGSFLQGFYSGLPTSGFNDPNGFNYALSAMALGGVFVVPGLRSILIATIGVCMTTLVLKATNVFLAPYGIPVFTLPFAIVTLAFISTMSAVRFSERPQIVKATPEETRDHFKTVTARFSPDLAIAFPFNENWTVWQGFDGKWTHQGLWKYAVDFVITDLNGRTYSADGTRLDHYYCYQKPVLSPVRGQVIRVVDFLPDNPIGTVDTQNNWGNFVLIRHDSGQIVKLCHFTYQGIGVSEGTHVEVGTYLGLCGNSGYSPQPHVHLHVQMTPESTSPTIPFCFSAYIHRDRFFTYARPNEGEVVHSFQTLPFYDQLTTFILDDELDFDVYMHGQKVDRTKMRVAMAEDGTFYFSTKSSKLYFGKSSGTFYCYHLDGFDPYLRMLYMALPKLPLSWEPCLKWSDVLPNSVALTPIQRRCWEFMALLWPGKTSADYYFVSETEIEGVIHGRFLNKTQRTYVQLDPHLRLKCVRCDFGELRRATTT